MTFAHAHVMLTLLTIYTGCNGYPEFQQRVPNGNRVPHPCLDNYRWSGLGHEDSAGGGERNAFGRDFDQNGQKWDTCLCEQDSDGDGRSNGEELGDPNCVWREGDVPAIVDGITHPGVCEPLDSPLCQEINDWEFCTLEEFVCDAIDDTDVIEVRHQFPLVAIPPEQTNYFCMTFDFPSTEDYHLIAYKPILNNTLVEHHMLVFGCPDDYDKYRDPEKCGMAACSQLVALWAVGVAGECLPDHYGIRVGQTGFKTIMIQIHWDNPDLRDDLVDAPGMSFYISPNLRPNDAGILQIGTLDITIPGRSPAHTLQGGCRSACSQTLASEINIDFAYLHMHYLGIETSLLHESEGVTKPLVVEKHYSYDNPIPYRFSDPVVYRPGDNLYITCTYNTLTKHAATPYGEGTSEEMCYSFVIYYPALPDWDKCDYFRSIDNCPTLPFDLPNCDEADLVPEVLLEVVQIVAPYCNVPGASPENCPEGCAEIMEEVKANYTCLDGDAGAYVEGVMIPATFGDAGMQIVALLHTCDPEWDRTLVDPEYGLDDPTNVTTPLPTQNPDPGPCVFDVSGATTNQGIGCFAWAAGVYILIAG